MRSFLFLLITLIGAFGARAVVAQQETLGFVSVERPPFSYLLNGEPTGFSVDLMNELAERLGREVEFTYVENFGDMLSAVEGAEVDGAIANISITADREAIIDFSQPYFESGLQIMVSGASAKPSIWRVILRRDLLVAIVAAFAVLFGLGVLMWLAERRRQPYFDRPAREAMFPSFWWALNLVVNGGFEERMPQSAVGRLLAVVMVVSSLFIVSIFVANITASLTIDAITGSIQSIDDLDGRKVATTDGSTASALLTERGVPHQALATYAEVIEGFESGAIDAVVFDGPILAYYVNNAGAGHARLIEREFRPENYGIALPQGSPLREPINRAILRLKETGAYQDLVTRWFGVRD